MELGTALIWTLRIALPIILFCIYFTLQSSKDEQYPGPTKNQHDRKKMLIMREAPNVTEAEVPECLANIELVDEKRAPQLFAAAPRRREERSGGRRSAGSGSAGGEERDRSLAKPREMKEGRERKDKESRRSEKPPVVEVQSLFETEPKPVPAAPSPPSPSEEKMHLESLLNYVAFNRKEQQRTFLQDSGAPPPPPPKTKKFEVKPTEPEAAPVEAAAKDTTGEDMKKFEADIVGATAEKANAEAQMVLSGAIKFKRADVAKNLYQQLFDSQVELTERTFTLMIEACVLARDLKSASDILMKMEVSGHCPDTELLDKVMDLYSEKKYQREADKRKEVKPTATVEALLEGPRAKLSSVAPIFVPMGVPGVPAVKPPPPTGPKPTAPAAPKPDESKEAAANEERTRLKPSAKPFQPQGIVTFDPQQYTWTVETSKYEEEQAGGRSGGKTRKSRGENDEGEAKTKSKGKSKGGAPRTDNETEAPNNKGKAVWEPVNKEKDVKKKTEEVKKKPLWKPKEVKDTPTP
mmetsp:Transcript_70928/g.154096  ORF Transcript_70928/g.154096 Transcript_70928/m.154096 type:complete len:522 (-) Transcript_70928:267-1832(-)|eukprot:CAMPEP_0170607650 /NCGR_PEP_ID=MMETSP0224-20130122/21167_1 /TAXON_ID=285029 /ORGANISM="Togula jolla, Strain CCCM 725" /LENGTH=521 /DNA_ID=CAMNT_0010932829 /DNA_START=136 /DNA_END=1701 /DNA_ORIENTATION=+